MENSLVIDLHHHVANNQYLSGGILVAAFAAFIAFLIKTPKAFLQFLIKILFINIFIKDNDPLFKSVEVWAAQKWKYSKDIILSMHKNGSYLLTIPYGFTFGMFEKRPIIIYRGVFSSHSPCSSLPYGDYLWIVILSTDIRVRDKLINGL